ncbi:molecular chaperone GroEL [Beijerinckia mobilis]|uniref:molecular chaperone GroEL n=1 Tax=Beijerinckia mobilis TaxID=231434 RepID=UPI000557B3EE|nr:molecular chaperone GroEL [Beijerinckia mobilis]
MVKLLLHGAEARAALAIGVGKLAAAVSGTLGPRGLNTIIDRPVGPPIVSRDGVSIAEEIELECRFENLGAQVVRQVSKQTEAVAGDGTTTSVVLANALIQDGAALLAKGGAGAMDLLQGLDLAGDMMIEALEANGKSLTKGPELYAITTVAGTESGIGTMAATALEAVGADGIIDTEESSTLSDKIEVMDGFCFDRGYVSHHMIDDVPNMRAVLDNAAILVTDHAIKTFTQIEHLVEECHARGNPLLILAEDVDPSVIVSLLALRAKDQRRIVIVHPPEFGHWRKAMMEDIAILTGGEVISKDLGYKLESTSVNELGKAARVVVSQFETLILHGSGTREAIEGRRQQILKQLDLAPQNVERDKLIERLSKMTLGTVRIFVGGATPAERRRRLQLFDDALCAGRAALKEGVVAGGGTALAQLSVQIAPKLRNTAEPSKLTGIDLFLSAMRKPLAQIAENAGHDPISTVDRVLNESFNHGFDARKGTFVDMFEAGILDPVKVTITSVRNAVSSAKLILGTNTLIVDKPDYLDPTEGPARGGGGEKLGRA